MRNLDKVRKNRGKMSRETWIRFWWGSFVVMVLAGMMLVIFRGEVLPERFDGDAQSINTASEVVRENPEAEYIDRYYTNTGRIFGWLGVADKPVVVGMAGYLMAVGLVLAILWRWRDGSGEERWGALGITGVVLGLTAVYLGTLSKDIFGVMLVAAPLVIGGRKKWGFPASLAGAVVFGLVFRPYFVVVALLAGGYWLTWRYAKPKLWQWLGIVMVTVAAGAVGYWVVTGGDISGVREINNEAREAVSILPNVVEPGGWWGGIVNSLVAGALMIVPLPMFVAGGLYHVGAGLLLMGIVGLVIWLMRDNNFRGSASVGLVWLIGLFTVQCLFEPDLGSVLRHWTMLGVVFVFTFCATRGKYAKA